MKEKYLTAENIEDVTDNFFSQIDKYRNKHDFPSSLMNSSLLVLDMQKYFISEKSHAYVPSVEAILRNVISLINIYHKIHRPVIFTRHIDQPNGHMQRWWKKTIPNENEFSEIAEEMKDYEAEIIEKSHYDAFYESNLNELLKENKTNTIVLTGLVTHLCYETTARSAFIRDYDVLAVIDATADYESDFHLSSFINLSHGFAIPVKTSEIVSKINAERK